jgi:cyclic beta-1,2-glucan synthetase
MTQVALHLESQQVFEHGASARLQRAAEMAAGWEVVLRPAKGLRGFTFISRIRAARRSLARLEAELARHPVPEPTADPDEIAYRSALLELGASRRLLRNAMAAAADRPARLASLPRVILQGQAPGRAEELRVAAIAGAYLNATDGVFDGAAFGGFVQSLQRRGALLADELWEFSTLLKFVLLESLLNISPALFSGRGQALPAAIMTRIRSLREVANTDWECLIEPLIVFDAVLREDPACAYAQMDFESRERYRRRVALVARRSDCSELQVARIAIELAREGEQLPARDPRLQRRRAHVGYYLIDKGFAQLALRTGFHPGPAFRAREFVRAHGEEFFLDGIQILALLLMALILFPIVPVIARFAGLLVTLLLLAIPATQLAVDLVNNTITSFIDPERLPKLDFGNGIPAECTTLVAVPSLLMNEKQVRELVNDLEVRFLANREPNLHFALLTDLPDSVSQPRENDSHPLVDLAAQLIDGLNARYNSPRSGAFILLHRHRIFNARQGVWMGWERKRGKLLDLNKLLAGAFDAFPIKAGRVDVLKSVRYILTLDSDTQLPHGTAARLAGAIAHPLNQAIIDPQRRIVTAGYGILQPRISVAVQSAAQSRLAALYSGQSGFDIYTRAVSDAYQDLFGEGIFTGKGIYEAATLHAVLDRRFPRNALLSHDLIEGAYARAGLVTDVELVDDYPSHYSAYMRRKHRWVRGDWQIMQWIFSRVPDEAGRWGPNPISGISRWKIFDNLRRSLVDPSLFLLFVFGWLVLPGGPLYWTVATLFLLFFPTFAQFVFGLGRAMASGQKGRVAETASGFGQAMLVALLHLVFLPHETLMTFDAIIRSLFRRFVTGERLLEWETAYQSEMQRTRSTPIDRYLALMPLIAASIGVLVRMSAARHQAILCALPILVLWALSNPLTIWLNRPPRDRRSLSSADRQFLGEHALRIWRYFCDFGGERHSFLIPDNVMEEGMVEAARVSPTNIGMLLNARQVACELGFLTVPEFARLSRASLATIMRLEKERGHLYNWYDTQTLQALGNPPFVSSVDSGNFVASLYTLHAGATDLTRRPLVSAQLFHSGLRAYCRLLRREKKLWASVGRLNLPPESATLTEWIAWLPQAQKALADASEAAPATLPETYWLREARNRIDAILQLLHDYLPWALPQFEALRAFPHLGLDEKSCMMPIEAALLFAEELEARLLHAQNALKENPALSVLADQLRALLPGTVQNLRALFDALCAIGQDAEQIAQQTDFSFLVCPGRQILSIGYERGAAKIHDAAYDMIASEARIATFLAIARGDLPYQSWYKLARDHTFAYGRFLLLSWTGTMFEYLMPSLWMRSYPGTLIARTQDAAVHVQRAFAGKLGIPWGISESGTARRNPDGHYDYFAFGVPDIALWLEATAGPVISPYSTFLALGVNPAAALANLRRMCAAGWVGAYGYYEAADYIQSARRPELVREWMAHHQGMSLLAIANLLLDNVVQKWFHENRLVQAAELLLHEMPISRSVLKARLGEFAPLHAG